MQDCFTDSFGWTGKLEFAPPMCLSSLCAMLNCECPTVHLGESVSLRPSMTQRHHLCIRPEFNLTRDKIFEQMKWRTVVCACHLPTSTCVTFSMYYNTTYVAIWKWLFLTVHSLPVVCSGDTGRIYFSFWSRQSQALILIFTSHQRKSV